MDQSQDAMHTTLQPPRPRRVRTFLLGAVILACGVLIGAGLTTHVLWGRLLHHARYGEHMVERVAGRMIHDLELTEEQAAQVERILTERLAAIHAIHDEARPRAEAELQRMREEVAAVLTPEQAERWNQRIEMMRERWLKHGPRGPWGRHGPLRPGHHPGPPPGP